MRLPLTAMLYCQLQKAPMLKSKGWWLVVKLKISAVLEKPTNESESDWRVRATTGDDVASSADSGFWTGGWSGSELKLQRINITE